MRAAVKDEYRSTVLRTSKHFSEVLLESRVALEKYVHTAGYKCGALSRMVSRRTLSCELGTADPSTNLNRVSLGTKKRGESSLKRLRTLTWFGCAGNATLSSGWLNVFISSSIRLTR